MPTQAQSFCMIHASHNTLIYNNNIFGMQNQSHFIFVVLSKSGSIRNGPALAVIDKNCHPPGADYCGWLRLIC